MTHPFARRTLASLKKDAKRWLAAIAGGDREARARLLRILPDAPDPPTLRDVQLALAREQGFDGWTSLKRALEPDPARSAATAASSAEPGISTLPATISTWPRSSLSASPPGFGSGQRARAAGVSRLGRDAVAVIARSRLCGIRHIGCGGDGRS